jgi:hypothetical protein
MNLRQPLMTQVYCCHYSHESLWKLSDITRTPPEGRLREPAHRLKALRIEFGVTDLSGNSTWTNL